MENESTDPLEGIAPVTPWVRLDSTRLAYIIAVTLSGSDHRTCDSDEKLDSDWKLFLRLKIPNKEVRNIRRTRINEWIKMHGEPVEYDTELLSLQTERVFTVLDEAVEQLREFR